MKFSTHGAIYINIPAVDDVTPNHANDNLSTAYYNFTKFRSTKSSTQRHLYHVDRSTSYQRIFTQIWVHGR